MEEKYIQYCDYCGKSFTTDLKHLTVCNKCREDRGEIYTNSEFSLYSNNGMKKKITGEFNQFNDYYFGDSSDFE